MNNFQNPDIHASKDDNVSQVSSCLSEREVEDMRKKRRIVKETHKLFNRQVIKPKNSKKKKGIDEAEIIPEFQQLTLDEEDPDAKEKKKKKKKKLLNPLRIFNNHVMPKVEYKDDQPQRYESRNIYELKFPRIANLNERDIRLEKECEPYLRQIIFDHNQVKKSASTPQFEEKMKDYKLKFAEYKQGIDELDEINRLAALNKYGAASGQIYIPPQYNLRTVKLYPPQLQAENMFRNYIPKSQLMQGNYVNLHDYYNKQSKPSFLPIIPVNLQNVQQQYQQYYHQQQQYQQYYHQYN